MDGDHKVSDLPPLTHTPPPSKYLVPPGPPHPHPHPHPSTTHLLPAPRNRFWRRDVFCPHQRNLKNQLTPLRSRLVLVPGISALTHPLSPRSCWRLARPPARALAPAASGRAADFPPRRPCAVQPNASISFPLQTTHQWRREHRKLAATKRAEVGPSHPRDPVQVSPASRSLRLPRRPRTPASWASPAKMPRSRGN